MPPWPPRPSRHGRSRPIPTPGRSTQSQELSMFTLRAATDQDLPRCFMIWRSAVLAAHEFLSSEAFREIGSFFEKSYVPSAYLLVAVDADDVPHGFLGATRNHVDALFVHAESHVRGVGNLLLLAFHDSREEVTVDVNAQNLSDRGFYEHLGFKADGRSDGDGEGRPHPLLHMYWRRLCPHHSSAFRNGFTRGCVVPAAGAHSRPAVQYGLSCLSRLQNPSAIRFPSLSRRMSNQRTRRSVPSSLPQRRTITRSPGLMLP